MTLVKRVNKREKFVTIKVPQKSGTVLSKRNKVSSRLFEIIFQIHCMMMPHSPQLTNNQTARSPNPRDCLVQVLKSSINLCCFSSYHKPVSFLELTGRSRIQHTTNTSNEARTNDKPELILGV
jgi:hypothetical protein